MPHVSENPFGENPIHGFLPSPVASRAGGAQSALIVDRRALFRDSLKCSLETHFPEILFRGADTFEEVIGFNEPYDLVILALEEARNAIPWFQDEAIVRLRERQPSISIIVVAENVTEDASASLLFLGVAGIVPESCSIEILVASLRFALVGGTFRPALSVGVSGPSTPQGRTTPPETGASEPKQVHAPGSGDMFTRREQEIMEHLHRGSQNKIIAHQLNISESTVKVHLRNIMKKLRVTNRTQVALLMHGTFP